MNPSRHLLIVCVLLACLISTSSASSKLLLVHYRPWFVAKPHSDHWGWHWTMDYFDPDYIDASGQRQIASWYRPLIGPYDSADPVVLEYHMLLMKLSGIDGLIVDWYGPDDYLDYAINNERTLAVFSQARRAGLLFALCYEDVTIQQQIDGGHLLASNAIEDARKTMLYAQSNYFRDSGYLRMGNRPVLLNFGPQYFKDNIQWESIFSVLEPTNRPAFFTEDTRLPVAAGGFNWPPMWLSLAPGARGVLSIAALRDYLDDFEEKGKGWPAYISSAFPRFHDIYESAGVRDYWGYLGDRNGQTFRQTLTRALTNDSLLVQIVTWNGFAEGTMIEPTIEYGYRDLSVIQEHRRLHLDPDFAFTAADLILPVRLYQLRRISETNTACGVRLDDIASDILEGNLKAARLQLEDLLSTEATVFRAGDSGERLPPLGKK